MTLIASSLLSAPNDYLAAPPAAVESELPPRVPLLDGSRRGVDDDNDDNEEREAQYEGSVEDQIAKDELHDRLSSRRTKLSTNSYGSSTTTFSKSSPKPAARGSGGKPTPADLVSDISGDADSGAGQNNQMPGRPGIDYPIHWQVPKTSFDCRNHEQSGFYADVESDCQAYHSCHKGRGGRHTFLCPNGTLFSQELLTCDWWYNVECSASRLYLQSGSAAPTLTSSPTPGATASSGSSISRPNFLSDLMANLREPLEVADIRRRHV